MKKLLIVLLAAATATLGMSGMALAFHEGGVAPCEECHTMHNSGVVSGAESALVINGVAEFSGNPYLLKGGDQSETCLNCHGAGTTTHSYHVMTQGANTSGAVPAQFGPGGDFAWLTASTASDYNNLGHSIIAPDYDAKLVADQALTTAPGGTYPAAQLQCSSCHDPHGRYRILSDGTVAHGGVAGTATAPIIGSGSYGAIPATGQAVGVYRLLGGAGYIPDSLVDSGYTTAFTANPPFAVAPSTYNTTNSTYTTGGGATVAYGSGMSEWCANCHGAILKSGDMDGSTTTTLRHPAGNNAKLTADIAANYNAYVKSGDMSGSASTSYWALVPFERGTTDRAALLTDTTDPSNGGVGATTSDNVMCLTCHRAHASGFEYMLRWNVDNEFLVDNGAYTVTPGLAGTGQVEAAYYDFDVSQLATYQRNLCNKCHAKD